MNNHHEYEKMAESSGRWSPDEKIFRKNVQWVVTEKVHGANFSFITDGTTVKCAKRSAVLDDDDDFYGYKSCEGFLATHITKVLDAWRLLKNKYPTIITITIYGELAGGHYPHDGVAADPAVSAVQRGVYYAPSLIFYAFDIATDPPRDYDEAMQIFESAKLFYAKALFVGPASQAMNYTIGFDSTIPAALGLPPLPKGTNKAEGVVAKPIKAAYVTAGKRQERAFIKIKIPEFAETAIYDNKHNNTSSSTPTGLLLSFVTQNRLVNVLSKMGRVNRASPIIAEALAKDALDSFMNQHDTMWTSLSPDQQQSLRSELLLAAKDLVTTYFKK